jgi:hypothetical protein
MLASLGSGPSSLFDFSAYTRFVSLVRVSESVRPKNRGALWLSRIIEELYDARYARDLTALYAGEGGGADDALAVTFPDFAYAFFEKRYGLAALVQQHCWDLLYTTHCARREGGPGAETFARFLDESLDADDLLYFLYARSELQKQVGISFRAHVGDLGRGSASGSKETEETKTSSSAGTVPTVFVPLSAAHVVARVVFGSETDSQYRSFVVLLERYFVPAPPAARSGARRGEPKIDAQLFLSLAVGQYREKRLGSGGAMPLPDIQTDRLVREALNSFDGRTAARSVRSPAPSATTASAQLRPSPAFLDALGDRMNQAMEMKLDTLLAGAASLPYDFSAAISTAIRAELSEALEAKVDELLAEVIAGAQGEGGNAATASLSSHFKELAVASLTRAGAGGAATQSFCIAVVNHTRVSTATEQLASLLITEAMKTIA